MIDRTKRRTAYQYAQALYLLRGINAVRYAECPWSRPINLWAEVSHGEGPALMRLMLGAQPRVRIRCTLPEVA